MEVGLVGENIGGRGRARFGGGPTGETGERHLGGGEHGMTRSGGGIPSAVIVVGLDGGVGTRIVDVVVPETVALHISFLSDEFAVVVVELGAAAAKLLLPELECGPLPGMAPGTATGGGGVMAGMP